MRLASPVSPVRTSLTAIFRYAALATAVATYMLVVLGGAVKAYGAGLACPDWPLCHGRVVPAFDTRVLLEWGHRLGASLVVLLTLATVAVGWAAHRENRRVKGMLLVGVGLLGVQVLLGAVTVWLKNGAAATSAHLGVATAFLSIWLVLGVWASRPEPGPAHAGLSGLRRLVTGTALAAWLLLLAGSYLKSSGGGLACPDWPLCQGRLVPSFDHWLVSLHWAHRVGALAVGILVMAMALWAWRIPGARRRILAGLIPAMVLYVAQAGLGAVAVLWRLPAPVTALHLAMGTAMFSCLVVISAETLSLGSPSGR